MTQSAHSLPLRREFDNFLFAVVGEGKDGGKVSVLSALARLDIDPWMEAEKLALLPPDTATSEMVSFIEAQSAGSLICPEPETTAYRLVALLPRAATLKKVTAGKEEEQQKPVTVPAFKTSIIWIAFLFLLVLTLIVVTSPDGLSPSQVIGTSKTGALIPDRQETVEHMDR